MISLGLRDTAGPLRALRESEPTHLGARTPEELRLLGDRLRLIFGNRFEVLQPIAVGGMATIFQLRHVLHGGLFVAKILHAELAGRPEIVRSFRAEARHAACVAGHPNAIQVFDCGELEGTFFILMPFVEGEDLDLLLQGHGPLSRDQALQFAAQISSLLCHAESHGITHCDVAPGNIRLDLFGRYRLLDFGISHSNSTELYRPIGGTPLYSSPEQERGEVPDGRSDIYSLGLVLCEVLTGKPLFEATSLAKIKEQRLRGDWRMPPEIEGDRLLSQVLRSMLVTDRSQRMASAFELSGALAGLGFDRPEFRQPRPKATPPGAAGEVRRPRLSQE